MEYWKEVLAGLQSRFHCVVVLNQAEIYISDYMFTNDVEVKIGGTTYTACGFYKRTGKTMSEKLLRNMERELEIAENVCYNKIKSQKGLDCKQERSIV